MDKILELEKKLFNKSTIGKIPFDFFNYIANLVVNPEYFDKEEGFSSVENFFKIERSKEAKELFQELKKSGISPKANTFSESYADLFLLRYQKAFNEYAKYFLRRIETREEYGLFANSKRKFGDEFYIAFDVNDFVPRLSNGAIDFENLKKRESKEHNIAALFSTMTSLIFLANVAWKSFTEVTTRGIATKSWVYGSELEELIVDLSKILNTFFAKKVYAQHTEDRPLQESIDNVMDYYAKYVNPDRYQLPKEMDEVEAEMDKLIKERLDSFRELSNQTKQNIYLEIVQTFLHMIDKGLGMPEFFHKVILRESNEFDRQDYRINYAADIYLIAPDGSTSKNNYETYGFILSDDSMEKVLKEAFNNDLLYEKFIQYD
ncbi:MAG TPA: hypothetical protein VGA67_00355 [Candidatus Dojkabacteria bacterium]|jgi:hypothetical protein